MQPLGVSRPRVAFGSLSSHHRIDHFRPGPRLFLSKLPVSRIRPRGGLGGRAYCPTLSQVYPPSTRHVQRLERLTRTITV